MSDPHRRDCLQHPRFAPRSVLHAAPLQGPNACLRPMSRLTVLSEPCRCGGWLCGDRQPSCGQEAGRGIVRLRADSPVYRLRQAERTLRARGSARECAQICCESARRIGSPSGESVKSDDSGAASSAHAALQKQSCGFHSALAERAESTAGGEPYENCQLILGFSTGLLPLPIPTTLLTSITR